MGTTVFRRPARLPAPPVPGGEVHLESPPEVGRTVPAPVLMRVLPLGMVLASVGMVAVLGVGNPTSWVFGGMFVLSGVGMLAGGAGRGGGARRAEADAERTDYLRYLAQVRRRAREAADGQRAALEWTHPEPAALAALARGPRMWERRAADPDFVHVRVGRGAQRLATPLVPPRTGPVDDLEPVATLALRRLVRTHSVVADLPTAVSLRAFAAVGVAGPHAAVRDLARAVVAQLVALHGPDDLLLAVLARGPALAAWEWTKWLPHTAHPRLRDGAGPVRLVTTSTAVLEAWLAPELAGRTRVARDGAPAGARHVVVVLDDAGPEPDPDGDPGDGPSLADGLAGVTLLDLSDARPGLVARRGLRLEVAPEPGSSGGLRLGAAGGGGVEWFGRPDALSVAEAEALARRLAPCRPPAPGSGPAPAEGVPGLLELLGVDGAPDTFDVAAAWRPRAPRERFRVPIGVDDTGAPVELDLKEAAQEGMGPHGLCVGATGSGKSELLRTVVLGLVATHSSEDLNLVLVDFKGGATFAGLAGLPHVAAVITNLADDLGLVDRMQDALAGEMNRRQELLRAAGNLASVADHERARRRGEALAPLPTLLVVVDEFSELLTQKPDFAELFVAVGRLGRSLRIHLLLASQRLEEGRLRGLESHLSYRIGLRTFSASDSRAALGVPDAHELPPVPGAGYLRTDPSTMLRFTAGYVSGPVRGAAGPAEDPARPAGSDDRVPRFFRAGWVDPPTGVERSPTADAAPPAPDAAGPSVLDVVVERLRGQGPPAHEVWLPPLAEAPALDALLPPLEVSTARGLHPPLGPCGRLAVPVGLVDRPYDQRRDALWVDLAGGAGHAAVVGGPQSGKSTLLATLVLATALTHTPEEARFVVVDAGGGTLAALEALPHVSAVAGRGDVALVRRAVAEVSTLLADRERTFRARGVGSVAEVRERRRQAVDAGRAPDADAVPDVVLVVDGWASFRGDHEELEATVVALASAGLSYGVHVVVAASRWAEIRPALKDLLGTRLELRLGDPAESEVDRRVAATVPVGRPGRGLSPERLHVLGALPRADGAAGPDAAAGPGAGTAALVARVAAAWSGPVAPPVRLLPALVGVAELPGPGEGPAHLLPIGVDEERLAPVHLDVAADPHLLCFADAESGKTALLRTIAHQVVTRFSPEQARLMIVDYRRGLLGAVESDHLISYTTSADALTAAMAELTGSLGRRMPGPDVTAAQLRARSWWTGPEVFVLVDDHDLVATSAGNPLTALLEYLPHAADVGLHLVLTRRSGGAARAMFEPVLARLRELSAPGLVMSGSREEGALVGSVRPAPRPPGRGVLVGRRHPERLVQVAWRAPEPPIRPTGASDVAADPDRAAGPSGAVE